MNASLDAKLITLLAPQSPAAEAYRILRTNLQFAGLDRPLRSLAVTSAAPEEGKSLTAANLAIAFAQAGQQVALVDADLRRPTLQKMFGLGRLAWGGLTSVLAGGLDPQAALKDTEVEGLRVLPTGPIPPNPAELLGSQRMRTLMAALAEQFDLVIYDTPPVLAVADAAILAPAVDGAILVVRAYKVGYPQARRAKEALEGVGARVVGVVLDGVRAKGEDGYYYYYHYGKH